MPLACMDWIAGKHEVCDHRYPTEKPGLSLCALHLSPYTALLHTFHNSIDSHYTPPLQAPRLLFMRVFSQYFEGKPAGLNPPSIIRATPLFQQLRNQINQVCILRDALHGMYGGLTRSIPFLVVPPPWMCK